MTAGVSYITRYTESPMRWSSRRVIDSAARRLKSWDRSTWLTPWDSRNCKVNSTNPHSPPLWLKPWFMSFSVAVAMSWPCSMPASTPSSRAPPEA